MSSSRNSGCSSCVFFKVHDLFDYIGYCTIKDELIVGGESGCPHYKPVDKSQLVELLRERGWIYCVTCKKPIYSEEELDEYLEKYRVNVDFFNDTVAAEESPAAD